MRAAADCGTIRRPCPGGTLSDVMLLIGHRASSTGGRTSRIISSLVAQQRLMVGGSSSDGHAPNRDGPWLDCAACLRSTGRRDPKPGGVRAPAGTAGSDGPDGGPADQGVGHRAPEHRVGQRDEGEDRRQRREDDGRVRCTVASMTRGSRLACGPVLLDLVGQDQRVAHQDAR